MKQSTTFIVIGCCFKDKRTACPTTIARLKKALSKASQINSHYEEIKFIVTGNVPYQKEGPSLSSLMKSYLVAQQVRVENILEGNGYDTFSQSRFITRNFGYESTKIVVVSSNFYFRFAKSIWEKRAREISLPIEFVSVEGGRFYIHVIYSILGFAEKVSSSIRLGRYFEKAMTCFLKSRREKFTSRGC